VFVVVAVAGTVAGLRHDGRRMLRWFVVYLAVATIHVVVNIGALLSTAHVRDNDYLWGVWDVGAAYMMIVAVFTGWYWACDLLTPGGAFEFPSRLEEHLPPPNLVDYLFIAFNINATFGPTAETVRSRTVKLLMMLQASCTLVILLVFVARVVGIGKG
jgi:hypothetical protein